MTTIAYRNGRMAADTAVSDGSHLCGYATKITHVEDMLIGAAGDAAVVQLLLRSFESGRVLRELSPFGIDLTPIEDKLVDKEFTLLVVKYPYMILEYTSGTLPVVIQPILNTAGHSIGYAIGSGADIALGSMLRGADAQGAVQDAARIDLFTGGEIKCVQF